IAAERVRREARLLEAVRPLAPRQRVLVGVVRWQDAEADQAVAILVAQLEDGSRRLFGVEPDLLDRVAGLLADAGGGEVVGLLRLGIGTPRRDDPLSLRATGGVLGSRGLLGG